MGYRLRNMTRIAVCVGLLLLAGCGKSEDAEQSEPEATGNTPTPAQMPPAPQVSSPSSGGAAPMPTQQDMADAAKRTEQMLAEMNQNQDVETVDFRKLKELLPETLPGMKRTDATAERTKVMAVDMATAKGQYQLESDQSTRITITIVDLGNVKGPVRMAMAGWATTQFDRETDTGYQRTVTHKGCKGMEKWDKNRREAALHLFVGDRFVVHVEGQRTSMEAVKKAVDEVDLAKLASLGAGS